MLDIVLAVANGIFAAALACLGVYVSLQPPPTEKRFLWMSTFAAFGLATCGLIGVQAYRSGRTERGLEDQLAKIQRSIHQAPTAQENAQAVVALERQNQVPAAPSPHPHPRVQHNTPPASTTSAELTVTQSPDVSSNADAPYKTRVVVQTTKEFPSLRLALECDGPILRGYGGVSVMMVTSQGVVNGHPNIYVITYQAAMPPFGPANPMQISLWSKQPLICAKASTF